MMSEHLTLLKNALTLNKSNRSKINIISPAIIMSASRVDIESTLFIRLRIKGKGMTDRNESVLVSMDEEYRLVLDLIYFIFRVDTSGNVYVGLILESS
jgi:hypothetical protein